MKAKTLILAGLAMLVWLLPQDLPAASVPAGTLLVVRTLDTVHSTDAPGTRFMTKLANNVAVNGKVVLPTATTFSGKIVTSRRTVSSSLRLTVNLTEAHIGGRAVPLKTTGARELSNDYQTKHGISVSRAAYTVPAGKRIEFQLAQPLNL